MKIPFPLKVFVSYLAILAFVAAPIGLYLSMTFSNELVEHRSIEIIEKTEALQSSLNAMSPQESIAYLQKEAKVYSEDISFFGPKGNTLFSSSKMEVTRLKNPKKVDRRFYRGMEYVIVTRVLPDSQYSVQLSFPIEKITVLTDRLIGVFRNTLDAAVTLALLFSLLASFVFLRPLRRLVRSANALADGQYDATEKWDRQDEISDVGRALNALALKIRLKLAGAYAAETIMSQVVENVETCVAIFNNENELVVSSGKFHELLNGDFLEIMGKWTLSERWEEAQQEAAKSAKGIPLRWTKKHIGVDLELHRLEHGNRDPFWMISTFNDEGVSLPSPDDCEIITIASLLDYFDEAFGLTGLESNIDFDTQKTVVDHGDRIRLTFSIVFNAKKRKMNVNFEKYFSKISVRIDTVLEDKDLQVCRDLLRPIDSEVKIDNDSTIIWLRRA